MKISVPVTIEIDTDEWARYGMNDPDATATEVRADVRAYVANLLAEQLAQIATCTVRVPR